MKRAFAGGLSLALAAAAVGPSARPPPTATPTRAPRCSRNASPATGSAPAPTTLVGPELNGVVGRKAGSVEGYSYSDANKNSGLTWDEATLTHLPAVAAGARSRHEDDLCRPAEGRGHRRRHRLPEDLRRGGQSGCPGQIDCRPPRLIRAHRACYRRPRASAPGRARPDERNTGCKAKGRAVRHLPRRPVPADRRLRRGQAARGGRLRRRGAAGADLLRPAGLQLRRPQGRRGRSPGR